MNIGEKSNKRKVALFERVGSLEWISVWWANVGQPDDEADASQPDGYVRISQYVEVTFPPLDPGPIVEKQLEQLAKAEQKIREEFQKQLNQINDTRQRLLALPNLTREDTDPAPYCSYGHKTQEQCDCGPIAANE